jgi:AraC-like DNA-binding protein
MQMLADLSPQDRLLWQGEGLTLGSVQLDAEAPDFGREKALRCHHLVWPHTAMLIRMQGFAQPLHASPMAVTLHSPGFVYRRERMGAQGDHSDYLMLTPDWMEELLHRRPPNPRFGRLHFGCAQRAGTAPQALILMRLRAAVTAGTPTLALQAVALQLAADVLGTATPLTPAPAAVRRALAVLAQCESGPMPSLRELARRAAVSPFHLTRLFRRHTGLALHQYAMALRARQALLQLPTTRTLAGLAQQLGYRDGAHLARRLRQAFGDSPSALRRQLAPASDA